MVGELAPGSDELSRHMGDLQQLLNRRWAPHILAALSRRPMSYTELFDAVRAMQPTEGWRPRLGRKITDKVLHETLDAMQDDGLVARHIQEDEPARSQAAGYALTLTAVGLVCALRPGLQWVAGHPEVIDAAKRKRRAKAKATETASLE